MTQEGESVSQEIKKRVKVPYVQSEMRRAAFEKCVAAKKKSLAERKEYLLKHGKEAYLIKYPKKIRKVKSPEQQSEQQPEPILVTN